MDKVCFVNGSPRGSNSGSHYLVGEICRLIDTNRIETEEMCIVSLLKTKDCRESYKQLLAADSLVFVFPLYIDSIPSSMLDYLTGFTDYLNNEKDKTKDGWKAPRVYAVINCGFVEGHQNSSAMRIMQHFCSTAGLAWRFGVGIGAGEFMRESGQGIPLESRIKLKVFQALLKLKQDIEHQGITLEKSIFTNPTMPKRVFMLAGNHHWIQLARKSKVKKKMLYARPYEEKN